jgi:hypothetical protein
MPIPFRLITTPFLGLSQNDELLPKGLEEATEAKRQLHDALMRANPRIFIPTPQRGLVARASSFSDSFVKPAEPQENEADIVKDPKCTVVFNAERGLTTMTGSAKVRRSEKELAPILDPRSWSASGGVIGAAFIVEEGKNGTYTASSALKDIPLGEYWEDQYLFEYARSEVASFENILHIVKFEVGPNLIKATYQLHDCLICTIGFFSAPGGLMVNEGHVLAEPAHDEEDGWWRIEVRKVIQVRDLTPNDPGNRYDFGESVNSTIGAALSQWVHDTSLMRPVFQ